MEVIPGLTVRAIRSRTGAQVRNGKESALDSKSNLTIPQFMHSRDQHAGNSLTMDPIGAFHRNIQ